MNQNPFYIPANPDQIQEILSPVCSIIYEGLTLGSEEARRYFESRGEPVERFLGSCLTRYHAKFYIRQKASIKTPFQIEELGNNGISILYRNYRLRVLKGVNGDPPTAQNSKRGRSYYSQSLPHQLCLPNIQWQQSISSDWNSISQTIQSLNLIVCWEVDSAYSISLVQLMCPQKSGRYGQGVRLHWKRTIQHPALGIQPARMINDDDTEDLEIFFEDAANQDLE